MVALDQLVCPNHDYDDNIFIDYGDVTEGSYRIELSRVTNRRLINLGSLVSVHKHVGIHSQRLVLYMGVLIRLLVCFFLNSVVNKLKDFFIHSMATTTFAFMLSVFFTKANTASAVSGLVWFIFYAVYSFTMATYESLALYEKMLISILSNTAMAFGFQLIIRLEGTSEGLQWNNFWRPISVDDNISVGLIMVMLLVCTGLYLIVALYVEKIFPGTYGVPQPWYFPFTKSYWCGQSNSEESDENHSNENPDHFEEDPPDGHCGIKAINLRKLYARNKVAVEGFTINMYDDQITVLLGHNGAGQ